MIKRKIITPIQSEVYFTDIDWIKLKHSMHEVHVEDNIFTIDHWDRER